MLQLLYSERQAAKDGHSVPGASTMYRMPMLYTAVLCLLAVSQVRIIQGQGTDSVTLPDTDVCGKRDASNRVKRVIGGSEAYPGMYPWMAALGYTGWEDWDISWRCAASLVTDRHLITGAECVTSPYYNLVVVRLGVIDLSQIGPTGTEYEVDNVTAHPGFNRSRTENDIAIIRLKNKVTFSRLIQPICLPTLDEFRTKRFTRSAVYIAGWGYTNPDGPKATRLQHAQLQMWDQKSCQKAYRKLTELTIDDKVFCASEEGKDACRADGGGPLMLPYGPDSNYYLYGIVSFGLGCADPIHPGVYTRVSEFMDWIVPNLK